MSKAWNVLVIDDEPMITRVVMKVCAAEGMSVTPANSAAEAFRCLRESSFDLILCDIMMNECDGFQFLEQLAGKGISAPVVMMTGYSTTENAVRSLVAGAVDYIAKPFTVDELLTVVQRGLRCGMLLNEAALPSGKAGPVVPCPGGHMRLGNVSWVLMEEEGTAKIGACDLFLKSVGGIREFRLSAVGEALVQGGSCAAALALDGAAHDIMCPMSGKILTLNPDAQLQPAMIEKDPYIGGWLYRILPSDPDSSMQALVR